MCGDAVDEEPTYVERYEDKHEEYPSQEYSGSEGASGTPLAQDVERGAKQAEGQPCIVVG